MAAPARRQVDGTAALGQAAKELGYPDRPLVAKPRRRAGGQGIWVVRADVGLGTWEPPSLPLYAVMSAAATQREPLDLLVQELLPGVEVTVDVLADDGDVLAAVARTSTQRHGGFSVAGTVGLLWPPVAELIEQLVKALQWSQLLSVQLVWNPLSQLAAVYELSAWPSKSIGSAGRAGPSLLAAAIGRATTGRRPPDVAVATTSRYRRHWTEQVWPW